MATTHKHYVIHESITKQISEITYELWNPNAITHRSRSGKILPPLIRGLPRWRGTVTFDQISSIGDEIKVSEFEYFISRISQYGWSFDLPWGYSFLQSKDTDPYIARGPWKPTPPRGWQGTVTAVNSVNQPTITQSLISRQLQQGDWICVPYGEQIVIGSIMTQRTKAFMIDFVVNQGSPDSQGRYASILIGTIPEHPFKVGDVLGPCGKLLVESSVTGEGSGYLLNSSLDHAGPWTIQWEESL